VRDEKGQMTTRVPIDEEDGLLPLNATPVCVVVGAAGGAGTRLLAPEEGEDQVSIESSLDSSLESTTITSSPAPSLRSAGSLDKRPQKGMSRGELLCNSCKLIYWEIFFA
jgi:hypothetical protein